ncbi:MAG TPA: hypothetical protein VGZ29_02785 [Terriglobia bacterium]|nr:hypothetical protein [Terriglobia bacterium]
MAYRCKSGVQLAETDVLAVYCSDHRIQAGVREFLDESLNLRANYDSLVVPGGPQCLVEFESLPKFAWVGRKWSRALIQLHSLKRLVLIAHQDCGWYRWLEDYHSSRDSVRRRQEDDLKEAKQGASRLEPDLTVDLYYAAWNADDAMSIDSVPS